MATLPTIITAPTKLSRSVYNNLIEWVVAAMPDKSKMQYVVGLTGSTWETPPAGYGLYVYIQPATPVSLPATPATPYIVGITA